jgi:hypothetical protein
MLALSRRFLFIHVPKTGGNSLQNILRAYSDDEIVCRDPWQDGYERFELNNPTFGFTKHSFLSEHREKLPPELYAGLYKFACVRNPWDRAVSFYFSPHRRVTSFSRQAFIDFLHTMPSLLLPLRERPDQPLKDVPGNFDRLLRFERLQQDFDAVCDDLGIPRQTLPVRNRSSRGRTEDYFDDETVELVRSLFAEDIALTGCDTPFREASHVL